MEGIAFLIVILCVISIVLATASPFATLALKMRASNIHFSPIIPYFMPPQNILGPAAALQSASNATGTAALQGLGPAAALQSPANVASKTSNQTGTGGFLSKGRINSLIRTPTSNWIATGNWSMIIDNGSLTGFATNMTWYNSNGKASHTHEFSNLRPAGGTIQGKNIVINGFMDVGTNHRLVWKNVPSVISIQGGKTISISVDDNATNHHFAGQPVFGLVTSFVPCSDVPGANMEVLPSCQK
ncbi:MAG TPA: hypothetical protein VFI73_01295 [Candidatus Nitrosopolaris sp.]|nr:hypothetical protein [Candidatus Nitrosopolaris sp.]